MNKIKIKVIVEMLKKHCNLFVLFMVGLLFSFVSMSQNHQSLKYVFEDLGTPVTYSLDIDFVTNIPKAGSVAWTGLHTGSKAALIGVNTKTGKVTDVDITPYGNVNGLILFKIDENTIYIFGGQPGRFFRYDVDEQKLTPLGEQSNATYWMKSSSVVSQDGKISVGTFPEATVQILDTKTDEVKSLKQISDDLREKYVINLAIDKEGIYYFGVGMHHAELWTYNPKTERMKQLLPKKLRTYGHSPLWVGIDGNVYGRKGATYFLCTPDRIILDSTMDELEKRLDNRVGNDIATMINKNAELELKDIFSSKITLVKTDFRAPARQLFNINSKIHGGKIYGSTFKPGNVFTFDVQSGKFHDLGFITRGKVQVYDFLSYDKGIVTSSYTGGYIDYYRPDKPQSSNNARPIAALHRSANQERGVQLTLGPDGNIYVPTFPIKGFLGGTIVRITPNDWQVKIYKDLIPNQSFTSIASVPETGEIFVTSSVRGGSGSKATEKEAWIFLWNPKTEKITYKTRLVPGANNYNKAVRSSNGLIYGSAGNRYYAFNPITRKTVFIGIMPGYNVANNTPALILGDEPAQDGLIYGIDSRLGNLISINPDSHVMTILAQDDSIKKSRFAETLSGGYLYYEHAGHLMRVKVVNRE